MNKIRIQNYDGDKKLGKANSISFKNFLTKDHNIFSKHGFNILLDFEDPKEMSPVLIHLDKIRKEFEQLENISPISIKKFKRIKLPTENSDWQDYRDAFIKSVIEKSKNDQDKLISLLRDEGFVFMDSLTLLDRFPKLKKDISKIKLNKYQWMVRMLKAGVSPDKDKMDPYIIFGIEISPKRKRKTLVYLNRKFLYSLDMDIPVRTDGVKVKPIQLIKYPEQMDYKERNAWGKEHRKLLKEPELKPSRFYLIYNQDIEVKGDLIIIELNNRL